MAVGANAASRIRGSSLVEEPTKAQENTAFLGDDESFALHREGPIADQTPKISQGYPAHLEDLARKIYENKHSISASLHDGGRKLKDTEVAVVQELAKHAVSECIIFSTFFYQLALTNGSSQNNVVPCQQRRELSKADRDASTPEKSVEENVFNLQATLPPGLKEEIHRVLMDRYPDVEPVRIFCRSPYHTFVCFAHAWLAPT